jgi:pyruvate dehydrogenase E2 component (dihydrolipoamide acetyltransferase)
MNEVRRKLAIATWSAPREGNILGRIQVDATEALKYIEHLRATTGEKVTVTHLVGKAIAMGLAVAPGLNGRILFGKFIPHSTIDVTWLVALEDGANLAKAKVSDVDKRSLTDVAADLRGRAERLRGGRDADFEKSQGPIKMLPMWLLRPVVWLTGWLSAALGVSVPALGIERFPFGSCVVTSVGMFGLDDGFAPFTPFARVPLLVLVGSVKDQPVVVDGQIVIRPTLTITATLDHRFIDGSGAAKFAKTARRILENPWTLEGLPGRPAELAGPKA